MPRTTAKTSEPEIRTAHWDSYKRLELEFRTALAASDDDQATLIATAIRVGLSEIALEIKAASFRSRG